MTKKLAFTIVELLAATALAAVLLGGLLLLTGALARSTRALDQVAQADEWHRGVVELLRRDLAAATRVELGDGKVTLRGHGEIDRLMGNATHRPATVAYEQARLEDGRMWLFRRQGPGAGPERTGEWIEPVCPDVEGFALEALDEKVSHAATRPAARNGPDLPDVLVLTLTTGRPGCQALSQVLVLR
jgi:hypothetical protein